jgi:lipopolysaccharide biosynthesis protein
MDLLKQYTINVNPGSAYEGDDDDNHVDFNPLVNLIAYYLPQFHSIPENNRWWGNGFTDWTNVTKAVPRFVGHYQPRLPGELGFYDLRNKETLARQAELARAYGIGGFCFHYYWFNGDRLLETPLNLFLQNTDINMSFCINWANENWTRRWDGRDKEVIKAQYYSAEDDIAFIKGLEPLFRDPRYIRVNGRPLLMLYKPSLLPDAAATVRRWRMHCNHAGLGDPYIIMPQMYDDGDPRAYGMDAAAGFPPHRVGWSEPRIEPENIQWLDPDYQGVVFSYDTMISAALSNRPKEFRLFPGVCPSWDNDARRPGRSSVFHGATPKKYGQWLAGACDHALQAQREDERIVFINAWNEWAEGAYLEPDRHYGYAFLAETAHVLRSLRLPQQKLTSAPQFETSFSSTELRQKPRLRRRVKKLIRVIANKMADRIEAVSRAMRL